MDSDDFVSITRLRVPPDAQVAVPGSKSETNRALPIAALAAGRSVLHGALVSDDTEYMADGLRRLGIDVVLDGNRAEVVGCNGAIPAQRAEIFAGMAGTTSRFLVPVAALGHGTYRLDGEPRLRQRPIAPLLDVVSTLGAEIDFDVEAGHLPITLHADGLIGGSVEIQGAASSQFISALLLAGPYMPDGLSLTVTGEVVSRPYIDMTVRIMHSFSVEVEERTCGYEVAATQAGYQACEYWIEPDASAASYFFAAAAITGGRIVVPGIDRNSSQGDLGFVDLLAKMGANVDVARGRTEVVGPAELRGIDVDMRDVSDTVPTLAVVAAFATTPTRIRGIGFIRAKESDRIGDVVAELRRFGVNAICADDGIDVYPDAHRSGPGRSALRPGRVDPHGDHRLAMSFAVAGLVCDGIEIADPGCVSKTFPGFFDALASLAANLEVS